MRNYLMRNAYKRAVQYFGSEHYRKAFRCTPYISILQADYRSRRNPVSMRLSSIEELRDILRVRNSNPNSITETFSSITTIGELLPLYGDSFLLLHNLFSKFGVTGSCIISIYS